MIYWFTGQPGHGKTTLCVLLKKYLEDKNGGLVMHIDGDDIREVFKNKDYSKEGRIRNITFSQDLAHFCHHKGLDVVVSLVSPYLEVRESFKEKMDGNMKEIYTFTTEERGREKFHGSDYESPEFNFLLLDTTGKTPEESLEQIKKDLEI